MLKIKRNPVVAQHGRAVLVIGLVSVLGILASAGFQIFAIRGLGPHEFGLFASFLAIINVAAIGSAALRNSVAVAAAQSHLPVPISRKRVDSSLIEALALGGIFTVSILVVAPWLANSLETNLPALIITAATVIPYFLFSRAQGLLQGVGKSQSLIWWSTGAQIAQLALGIVALALGYGAIGILGALLATAVLGMIGSTLQAKPIAKPITGKPFSVNSTVVLLLTISFAWITNADVILVRAGAESQTAGAFAAAAVLIKTTLIIPATLSLYLLPRFVHRRDDASMTRMGVNVTLAITVATGVAMLAVVLVFGELIVSLVFGPGYQFSVDLLPWLAIIWIPWAMAQAILIRLTASASKSALLVLLVGALCQWVGSSALLPDIFGMMAYNGILGLLTMLALFWIHLASSRRG
ncbi:MAG: hypothetical protein JWR57_939 [Mycetocola sp.]|nr:hypothetical protein [Mycetocola sp.]